MILYGIESDIKKGEKVEYSVESDEKIENRPENIISEKISDKEFDSSLKIVESYLESNNADKKYHYELKRHIMKFKKEKNKEISREKGMLAFLIKR